MDGFLSYVWDSSFLCPDNCGSHLFSIANNLLSNIFDGSPFFAVAGVDFSLFFVMSDSCLSAVSDSSFSSLIFGYFLR